MKKEKIIEIITEGKSLSRCEKLIEWIKQSDENQNEYIRYKNLWALMHRGKEMRQSYVQEDFKLVKAKINPLGEKFQILNLFKYAAIIIMAVLLGYFVNKLIPGQPDIAMNEISVPHGNRSLVNLPDGSKVWLTNGSKIIYPDRFEGDTRNIKLEGEAFFTVKHDKKIPFVVDLCRHKVKVLGTEFSVVSYPDDDNIEVDLVSGKIQMDVYMDEGSYKTYMLQPMNGLVLQKTSGKVSFSKIPDSFFNYWVNGKYEFKDETFASLAKKIERIYDVHILFEDNELKDRMFTGTFSVDDNIYTMMEVFKRASGKPFTYNIDRNFIYIKSLKN
jgi:transmembrane sensor